MTTTWKKTLVLGITIIVALALLGKLGYTVYEKREVLAFAWSNSDKVMAAKVANDQIVKDGDTKYLEVLSKVFANQ